MFGVLPHFTAAILRCQPALRLTSPSFFNSFLQVTYLMLAQIDSSEGVLRMCCVKQPGPEELAENRPPILLNGWPVATGAAILVVYTLRRDAGSPHF